MQSRIKYFALLSWLCTAQATFAEEPAALLNPTMSCTIRTQNANNGFTLSRVDMVKTREHVDKLVSGLRQALFRGDISSRANDQDSAFYAAEIESTLESCAGTANPFASSDGFPAFACQDEKKGINRALLNKANSSTIFQICDHECHMQLARFHVFMSGDFLFLRENVKHDANADALSKQHARFCAEPIIERAIDMNARLLSNSSAKEDIRKTGDVEADNKTKSNGVSLFASRNFDLQLLKLKALLASGDIDYQNVSGIQLLNQMGRIASTLSGSKILAQDQAVLLQTAYASYDAARWAIIEIRTEIPKTETDRIAALNNMDDQIRLRIKSVEEGKLFLNLDPEEFSSMPMDTLREQVMEVQRKIELVQAKVNELVAAGIEKKTELNLLAEDEYRTGSNYQLTIKSEKIAQQQALLDKRRSNIEASMAEIESKILKDKAKKLDITDKSNKFQESIDLWNSEIAALKEGVGHLSVQSTNTDLNIATLQADLEKKRADIENLNYRSELINADQQVLRAQFDLKKSTREFEIEQRQINALGAQELVALGRDKAADLQSHYQWLINLTMTKLNLDLQYKSLGGQITNSASRFKSSGLASLAKQTEYDALKKEYIILKKSLDVSAATIRQLYLKKYFDSAFRQRDLRSKACEYERQLAFMGSAPSSKYSSRNLDQFSSTEKQPGFPEEPSTAQTFAKNFILFDSSRDQVVGEGNQYCFGRRLGSGGLFSQEKAGIDNFEGLFDIDVQNHPRLEPAVNNEQFPLFGYYLLPQNFQPDAVNLEFGNETGSGSNPSDKAAIARVKKEVDDALGELQKPCETPDVGQSYKKYQEDMCGTDGKGGLRQTYSQNQEEVAKFITRCVKADTLDLAICAPLTASEATLARKIHDQKQSAANHRLAKIRELKTLTGEALTLLSGGEAVWKTTAAEKKAALEGVIQAISAAASNITISTTGPCGQGGCQLQSKVTDETIVLQAKLEQVKSDKDDLLQGLEFWATLSKAITELKASITQFDMEIQKIDDEKDADDLALDLTIAEISGSKRQYELQSEVDKTSRLIMIETCENDNATLNDKIGNLKHQHSQAMAEFAREDSERLSVDLDLSKERDKASQTYTQMQQLNSRIEKLNLEIADLRNQAKDSLSQIENSTIQLCLVDDARSGVDDFAKKEAVQDDLKRTLAEQYAAQAKKINEDKVEDSKGLWELTKPYLEGTLTNMGSLLGIVGDKRDPLTASQNMQANISLMQIEVKKIQSKIASSQLSEAEKETAKAALATQMTALVEQQTALDAAMVGKEQEKSALQLDLTNFASTVADKIINLRNEAEKDINDLVNRVSGPDGKVSVVAGAHDLFSQVFMAVPDYLERKRELIQRGNEYLNKIRSRINILSLVSNTKALPPAGYVRSSIAFERSLENAFDAIAGSGAEAFIRSESARIVIPNNSAFMLDLMEKGEVNFQIAPVGDYGNIINESERLQFVEDRMKEKGYLTLWSPDLDFANARILGVRIATEADCLNSLNAAGTVQLQHNGLGSILGTDTNDANAFAQVVSARSRSLQEIPVLHSANLDGTEGPIATWKALFKPNGGGGLKVWDLEEKRKNGALGLELMGMPVSGSYTLKVDSWQSSCFSSVKSSQLQIHFVISHAGSAS